jgi:hypothetical protein
MDGLAQNHVVPDAWVTADKEEAGNSEVHVEDVRRR